MYPWTDPLFPTIETLWQIREVEHTLDPHDCYFTDPPDAAEDGWGIPY